MPEGSTVRNCRHRRLVHVLLRQRWRHRLLLVLLLMVLLLLLLLMVLMVLLLMLLLLLLLLLLLMVMMLLQMMMMLLRLLLLRLLLLGLLLLLRCRRQQGGLRWNVLGAQDGARSADCRGAQGRCPLLLVEHSRVATGAHGVRRLLRWGPGTPRLRHGERLLTSAPAIGHHRLIASGAAADDVAARDGAPLRMHGYR